VACSTLSRCALPHAPSPSIPLAVGEDCLDLGPPCPVERGPTDCAGFGGGGELCGCCGVALGGGGGLGGGVSVAPQGRAFPDVTAVQQGEEVFDGVVGSVIDPEPRGGHVVEVLDDVAGGPPGLPNG